MRTKIILMALAALALAACSKTVTWKEEVQLSDGRVIVVERETLRVLGGDELASGGSGSRPQERLIRFEHPKNSGKQVEWRSTKTDENRWPERPLILDIIDAEVIVISAVPTSATCDTYVKYVFRDGAWTELPLPEEFQTQQPNLSLLSGPEMPPFIALTTKSDESHDSRYPRRLRQVGPHRTFCHG